MFKYLQIETTTFCNAKCWFCPNHLVPKRHMDMDLIRSIVDSTRGLGLVYRPFGLGDPLVDTRMPEICRYIKQDRTARVEIHTNGEPMTEKMELNIAPYVDTVRFSIDGFTPETFDISRGIDFDRVYTNARRFMLNNPGIDTQVRMIDATGKEAEKKNYLEYWNGIKPGCAEITSLYQHPHEDQTESLNKPCAKTTDEAFIYVDGSVHLCPWDFGNRTPVGDVNQSTIVDIWRSQQYTAIRQTLAQGRRCDISLCSRCNADFSK
ncbi:radical SAM protein [bacterium]|nr:radical SAM protein [bacterium]MDC1257113.1 radical SAM protein [bacterium]